MPFNSPMTHFLHVMCFFLTIYSFFLRITHFFHSLNYSFNNEVKIFIQRIYSFKKSAKCSFNEFIHKQKKKIIHSKKIFIKVKNGLSPRATPTHAHTHRFFSTNIFLLETSHRNQCMQRASTYFCKIFWSLYCNFLFTVHNSVVQTK